MECGENSLQENAFGLSEDEEALVIADKEPQECNSFLIDNICDTALSAESLNDSFNLTDWDQGPSSSGSTEPIQEPFKDMGIDNTCWYGDEERAECPAASLPLTNDPFTAMAGPMPLRPLDMNQSHADPLLSTPNNQLVLYKSPEEEAPKEDNAMAGSCGLRNLGNTCFMSAGIQCLAATPPLVRFFLSERTRYTNGTEHEEAFCSKGSSNKSDCSNNLMHDFSRLLSEIWAGKFSCISPHYFKRSLAVLHPQFKDYRQHDCQEFLTLLLDSLHEQLNDANKFENNVERGMEGAGCSGDQEMRSSNSDIAFLLTNGKNGFVEKNSLEQRLSPSLVQVPHASPNVSPRPEDFCSKVNVLTDMDDPLYLQKSFLSRSVLGIDINDYLKDAKTSNINVLDPQQCEPKPNNLIKFDSEKFSPSSRKLTSSSNTSTRSVHNMTSNRNGGDMVLGEEHGDLTQKEAESMPPLNGKRLKQTNLINDLTKHLDADSMDEACSNTNKRLKLVSHAKMNGGLSGIEMMDSEEDSVENSEELEADSFWQKHLAANRSIIVDSFQGQFKSTVICDVCRHVSVTFEPFMYLSVPLPHAMERQISVVFLPADVSRAPLRVLLTLKKSDCVRDLQTELVKLLCLPAEMSVTICEVLDNHISKILEPHYQLRFVNGDLRTIYAIEMLPPPPAAATIASPQLLPTSESQQEEEEGGAQPIDLRPNSGLTTVPTEAEMLSSSRAASPTSAAPIEKSKWPTCNICLEEFALKNELKTHEECNASACVSCLEVWKSKEKVEKCPFCHKEMNLDTEFTVLTAPDKKIVRILQVTVVFRLDIVGEECSNNKKSMRLIGHPRLVKLPSYISGQALYETLRHFAPDVDFQVLLVGGKGTTCSRCMFNKHCIGCPLSPDSAEIELQPNDALAIRLMGPLDPAVERRLSLANPPQDHPSMRGPRWNDPLTIYDCLRAFSESEELDKDNPWYCPKCRKNQCATKTLTVWRYPDILIIHLKRFVFNERSISKLDNKVTFPLNGLRLDQPSSKSQFNAYNLYSVVCHFGGASAGHYTAFAKHPHTNEWYNYNDESASKRSPQDDEFTNGYVLFYQRENVPELII